MSHVLTELKAGIATLTLNQPERRNCLSEAMLLGIERGIQEVVDRKARAVILRAAPQGLPEPRLQRRQAGLPGKTQAPLHPLTRSGSLGLASNGGSCESKFSPPRCIGVTSSQFS